MDKLLPRLNQMQDILFRDDLNTLLSGVYERFRSVLITSGALVQGSAATKVKNGSACYAAAGGVFRAIAANTDMPVLVGTVKNATFNVYVFSIDSAGNLYTQMGINNGGGSTLQAVQWPNVPVNRAVIGFIIINPTGAGDFVGGTTSVVDGSVIPNVVYVNTVGACDFNAPLR
jgi:hypothetical protein